MRPQINSGFACCKPREDGRIRTDYTRRKTAPRSGKSPGCLFLIALLSPERVDLTGGKPDEERYSCSWCGRPALVRAVRFGQCRGAHHDHFRQDDHVAGDLAKTVTGEPVQTRQKEIVKDLDELIASLEKQCQQCKNGMVKNNPTRPAAESTLRKGTGGVGDLVNPQEGSKDWAKISPRERDRILQSMSEGFPPEYRLVLERYYRRLAEEKTVAAGADRSKRKAEPDHPDRGRVSHEDLRCSVRLLVLIP